MDFLCFGGQLKAWLSTKTNKGAFADSAFLLAHKELIIKLVQGGTTGSEYNQFEGAWNEKRWDAYKNREERKTNDEPYL